MGTANTNRISGLLDSQFGGLIDMSDYAQRTEEERRKAFLSRALAALCISRLAPATEQVASAAVTDGFNDNGIDALYYDHGQRTLWLVQSYWNEAGTKPIDTQKVGSFVDGVTLLMASKIDRFNEKVKARRGEIQSALSSDLKVVLVTVHTAVTELGSHALEKVNDCLAYLNDPDPIATACHFNQQDIIKRLLAREPPKVDLSITLRDWGLIKKPFRAYYGAVAIEDLGQWWRQHREALLARNLRHVIPRSEVNEALSRTAKSEPEHFWYFNNGITIICDSVTMAGGISGRNLNIFKCVGANIVNGAQTVGTLGETIAPTEDLDEPSGTVLVRIISLENMPEGFHLRITKSTNLQNAVGPREIVALDPLQHKLANEFALDQRRYMFKSSDVEPHGESGCNIVEATQALACAHRKVEYSVLVKRNLGLLWADINEAPYTDLFNASLTSTALWRSVLVMRAVDNELQKFKKAQPDSLIGTHLNRVILHLVFRDPNVSAARDEKVSEAELLEAVTQAAVRIYPRVEHYVKTNHPSEYLGVLCKNTGKCSVLTKAMLKPSPDEDLVQGEMFLSGK